MYARNNRTGQKYVLEGLGFWFVVGIPWIVGIINIAAFIWKGLFE